MGTAKCKCGAIATLDMTYGDARLGLSCYDCANRLMRVLCVELARAASVAKAADGYYRWRQHVQRPCTMFYAEEVAEGKHAPL